ncbi:ADP-ribosylation factor GTPase-activating protein AGD3 [Camellia lanceoleosa]|uniref:ADP-ribosylation factor GTPase-activating protein AGD3 n=1 Tax=Camellia lanceoleosa TaxID=1840588 RepID=A0ACC0J0Q3_9ERIC|nr:ADP-ribosylation factor GTPase-activating protein AGD3 [Camellia lanceoleosa]
MAEKIMYSCDSTSFASEGYGSYDNNKSFGCKWTSRLQVLGGASEVVVITAISALSFSPDTEEARKRFDKTSLLYDQVTALSNVEAKKRFEFLEVVSGTMDVHLRYFKQGYELLNQMEPYISQIDRESRRSSNGSNGSPNGDGIQAIGRSSHKMIEAVMQSAAKGKVK